MSFQMANSLKVMQIEFAVGKKTGKNHLLKQIALC